MGELTVSTDGSALGNPNAEASMGKTGGLSRAEVSGPDGSRTVRSDSPLTVSTDGSALGNPNGPMGWGWADHQGGGSDAGGASNGTNQIGELCAVLQALRAHPGSQDLIIESDSQYAINCSTKWVHGWKRNGWKNSKKQSVKNAPLIKAIDAEISGRSGSVKFKWVKGHAGNEFNEKVDDLAHGYASRVGEGRESGYLPLEGWQSLLESPYAEGLDLPDEIRQELSGASGGTASQMAQRPSVGASTSASAEHHAERTSETPSSQPREPGEVTDPVTPIPSSSDTSERPQVREAAQSAPSHGTQPSIRRDAQRKPHLKASGRLRLSPPPSSGGRYAQASLHVSGNLQIDAPIDADGYIDLHDAVFIMDWFSATEAQTE